MNIPLLAVYVGLALLGTLLVTSGTQDWRLRLVVIVTVPVLSFALWQAAQPPLGWPTSHKQPQQAGFLWGVIREPDPQTNDPGRIFLWLDVGTNQPRAFALPYTRQLHRQVQAAMDAVKHGTPVAVSVRPGRPGHRPKGQGQRGAALRFYRHPPVVLPAKQGAS